MDETTAAPERRDAAIARGLHARRAAAFRPDSFDSATRSVEVVFTTGAEVTRTDWWTGERWVEALEVSAEAMDLSRLNAGAPVLNTHGAGDLGDVIGVVERAWIDNGRGIARIRFSDREEIAGFVADVAAGVIRNVSVGYAVHQWREEEIGGRRRKTATRWEPMEISFVPVPADAQAQVRAMPAHRSAHPANPASEKENDMTDQVTAAPAQPDADRIRAEAQAAERARIAEIGDIARLAGLEGAERDAFVSRHTADGTTPDAARRAALELVAARRGTPSAPAHASIHVIRDEGDTRMRAVEGALMARLSNKPYEGPAVDYRSASLIDLARATIEVRGVSTRGWSRSEIARAALGLPTATRGMQTSSDFSALLSNVQSKRMLAQYDKLERTFLAWCARRALPDFKPTQIVELGGAPELKELAEGGSIEIGVIQDSGETYRLVRYARNLPLSYVAIVNDDLGGFDRLPLNFATTAAVLENRETYGILKTNANMSDGVPLFHASHDNTSAHGMTVDGVSALRTLLARKTDLSGQPMMVQPSVIIVPCELQGTAEALFSPAVVPAAASTNNVNPWRGTFTIVSTQFLTDPNDWFMTVAAGTGYEAVEVGYEAGNEAPQLTSFVDPNRDGITYSLRHSFGCKAATWRTIARATG